MGIIGNIYKCYMGSDEKINIHMTKGPKGKENRAETIFEVIKLLKRFL